LGDARHPVWARGDVLPDQPQRGDFLLESSFDGQAWQQLRITHLHKAMETLEVGVYACSPIGKEFWCRFKVMEIAENEWFAKSE
jgi:regulation of enolase protein 1 (concanavalin A-like superfamily)